MIDRGPRPSAGGGQRGPARAVQGDGAQRLAAVEELDAAGEHARAPVDDTTVAVKVTIWPKSRWRRREPTRLMRVVRKGYS